MRIVYLSFPTGQIAGGQKVIARHVETLRELGFDAVWWRRRQVEVPWLSHTAPVEVMTPFQPDDVLVLPCDAPTAIRQAAGLGNRAVIFVQNHFHFASTGAIEAVGRLREPRMMAVGPSTAQAAQRAFPAAPVDIVPAFADERVFRPELPKTHSIVHAPWKRALEAAAIRSFLKAYHPRHARTPWVKAVNATEGEMATALGRYSTFLCLSRLEGLGLTPLEAMASGCVVAGFTGVAGRDFATADNGFWVDDDDCIGAADALAEAADLALTGGPALARRLEAGRATAEMWSYARFRTELEAFWMRVAPQARVLATARA